MPRPTKKRREEIDEVRRLKQRVTMLEGLLAEGVTIEQGLRADLAGADRANKAMQETLMRANDDAHTDAVHLLEAETKYYALKNKHLKVCAMWADMASQFDEVEVQKRSEGQAPHRD